MNGLFFRVRGRWRIALLRKALAYVCLAPLLGFANVGASDSLTLENQLADHVSPYLALHGEDPVAWQAWSRDALDKANQSGRLIFLSIGYFSCHWCHVLQQQSFRNNDTAKVINENYIPVKIDRELEPALDARFMEFAQNLTGRGGWPLNIFLTPEGYPLYASFYMPPENFRESLQKLAGVWLERRDELMEIARKESVGTLTVVDDVIDNRVIGDLTAKFLAESATMADELSGGFGESAKFPMVPQLRLMLMLQARDSDSQRDAFLETTLDAMAQGGLRDHLDGGFFRYTVDPTWQTPHYEKMLYTNAQLVRVYLTAADVLDQPRYLEVAADTLDFMLARMATPAGAFVAAFSAVDDANVEGGSYLWHDSELDALLNDEEREFVKHRYGLEKQIGGEPMLPRLRASVADSAARMNLDVERVEALSTSAKAKLLAARLQRGLPVDDKLLAGWNGLALDALVQASEASFDPERGARYRKASQRLAEFIRHHFWQDDRLWRAVDRNGDAYGDATIEDYAYVAQAFASAHDAVADVEFSLVLLEQAWTKYYVGNGWRQSEQDLIPSAGVRPLLLDAALASPSSTLLDTMLHIAATDASVDQTVRATLGDRANTGLRQGLTFSRELPFWTATQTLAMLRLPPSR